MHPTYCIFILKRQELVCRIKRETFVGAHDIYLIGHNYAQRYLQQKRVFLRNFVFFIFRKWTCFRRVLQCSLFIHIITNTSFPRQRFLSMIFFFFFHLSQSLFHENIVATDFQHVITAPSSSRQPPPVMRQHLQVQHVYLVNPTRRQTSRSHVLGGLTLRPPPQPIANAPPPGRGSSPCPD